MNVEHDLALDDLRGFVFDVDGTLVHRGRDGRGRPIPGAVEVLEAIRASGRPLVLFTNGSHVRASAIANGLAEDGLPVADHEVLTPIESAVTYLQRHHSGESVMLFVTDVIRQRFIEEGISVTDGDDADVVLVAHVDGVELDAIERGARAVSRGAPLLTGSYVPGYAGANGLIFSRGAMVTAAIAKVTGARPRVVGKPSRAAVGELRTHFGMPTDRLAVIGDDLTLDIRLGLMGGARTVLVRSGTSRSIDLSRVPARHRPHLVVDTVADLLDRL